MEHLIICTVIACIQPFLFAWYYNHWEDDYFSFAVSTIFLSVIPTIVCAGCFLFGVRSPIPKPFAIAASAIVIFAEFSSAPYFYKRCIKQYSDEGLMPDTAVFVYSVVWLSLVEVAFPLMFLSA